MTSPNGDGGSASDGPPSEAAVEIRAVEATAVDDLVPLWLDLAAGQRGHGSHILPEPNRSAVRDTLARHAVTGGVRAAYRDGDAVGFVSFALERGAYESDVTRGIVHNLYVVPDSRGRGVGSDLLGAAEAALDAAGASVVALEAMADNDAARRFYRREGYAAHRVELEKPVGIDDADADGATEAAAENDTHSKED